MIFICYFYLQSDFREINQNVCGIERFKYWRQLYSFAEFLNDMELRIVGERNPMWHCLVIYYTATENGPIKIHISLPVFTIKGRITFVIIDDACNVIL